MNPLIFVLNGPNLNMLGVREVELYGHASLQDIERLCTECANALGLRCDFRQTNHEGVLIDWMQEAHGAAAAGVIVNPGGLAHTSVALRDAAAAIAPAVVEVHLTNIHAREDYRRRSYLSEAAKGVISGLGPTVYALALEALAADV